jgi:hypothetical protein
MKQTDREGVNAVEGIFLRELGWIFREQTISDWGIDAHVEVTNRSEPTGRLLALQIKSGKSFFRRRGENFVFYGEGRQNWNRRCPGSTISKAANRRPLSSGRTRDQSPAPSPCSRA